MLTESRRHLSLLLLCDGRSGGMGVDSQWGDCSAQNRSKSPSRTTGSCKNQEHLSPQKTGAGKGLKKLNSCCMESCLPAWSLSDASRDTWAPLSLTHLLAPAADPLQVSAVFQCFTLWQNSYPSTYCLGASLLDAGMQDAIGSHLVHTHTQLKSQEG